MQLWIIIKLKLVRVVCNASVHKGIDSGGNVNNQSSRNQYDEGRHRVNRRSASAAQQSEPNLDHIHHREHQEQAPEHGSHGGPQHPKPQDFEIDMSPKGLVHILAVEEIDGELQALSNQGGEEEEAEGDNLKHQQPPGHVDPGVTDSAVLEAVLVGRGQG